MGWLGIIADDITGATDVASAVRAAGHHVVLTIGVPDGPLPDADAWVIALTTRQDTPELAVGRSVRAARALLAAGADVLYQKYCSTFDSTERGNIGPVGDALLALASEDGGVGATQVHTPATPRVGRTAVGGDLFVLGVPLASSPMKDHPLTPMRDSSLERLMAAQARRPVALVEASGRPPAGHVFVDATTEGDLDWVASWALGLGRWPQVVVGGAAGLAGALARSVGPRAGGVAHPLPRAEGGPGRRLVVAGSLSARTREQVAAFAGPVVRVGAEAVMTDPLVVDDALAEVAGHLDDDPERPVLVTSVVEPARATADQSRWGVEPLARAFEAVLGEVARRGVRSLGVTHVLCAGGETSGAVASALGLTSLVVGDDVAPGVPWTVTPSGLAVLFKSGNFGEPDLFTTAWEAAP